MALVDTGSIFPITSSFMLSRLAALIFLKHSSVPATGLSGYVVEPNDESII